MRLWKSGGRTWTPWAGLSEKHPKTATPFTSQRHHLACNEKGPDSVSQRASGPASARRQTPRRHHNPAVVEKKAAGMGRHSPGHVCRRPRQQHSHGNRSCSQACRHHKTNKYSLLSASHIFTPVPLKLPLPGTTRQLSWFRNWEGGRP